MIRGLKAACLELFLITYAKLTGYYKHIDKLPIYNWFKLVDGEYNYLFKRRIKNHPRFFKRLYMELFFQLEKVDMTYFEEIHKLYYLRSLYVTTKKPQYLNQANFLEASMQKRKSSKPLKLNDILSYIEDTLKSVGQIDVHKMSTSYFFHLYYRAIDKNKPSRHGNN
jgi:hypothetical protein